MGDRTVVGLVQINNSFSGQSYFPYSVGILQAYAEQHLSRPGNYEFLVPVFKRTPVHEAADQLRPANVVGFSMYVWNAEISLRIAESVKANNPEVLIIFGGPHVPNDAKQFLEAYPFIDVVVHGEGEKPFCALLENIQNWENAPSISYIKEGKFFMTSRAERMKDLSEVPSPYLEGTFDGLMRENPDEQWIVVWETNRGCPFGCTFCDWGSNTNAKIGRWDLARLYGEINWFAENKITYVFCADANFGILPHDLELAKYCVTVKSRFGYPSRLSVQSAKSTTKDSMEKTWAVQKTLSDGGLNQGVVISMQSLHEPTLVAIKRNNMKIEYFKEVQRRFTEGGVETMSDLILGLPQESYDSFADGVSTLIDGGQHNRIQFNNLSILPNAEMGNPFYQAEHGMQLVRSRIVNIHGSKSEEDEAPEFQQLVIATKTMPRPDWVRARVFAWMTAFLHFNKVLQLPVILTKELIDVTYREVIELFTEIDFSKEEFPELCGVRKFFIEKAQAIQQGGEEYCHEPDWLDIWWPADEHMLIQLATGNRLDAFYAEALELLWSFAASRNARPLINVLPVAVELNRNLIKMPFQKNDLTFESYSNVWEFCRGIIERDPVELELGGQYAYRIDRTSERWDSWADWYRKVIWYGNKRGAYLYGNAPIPQLAGHF